jgi:hypothetical protein
MTAEEMARSAFLRKIDDLAFDVLLKKAELLKAEKTLAVATTYYEQNYGKRDKGQWE